MPSCETLLLSCAWLPVLYDHHQLLHRFLLQLVQGQAVHTGPELFPNPCIHASSHLAIRPGMMRGCRCASPGLFLRCLVKVAGLGY